MKEKSYKFEGLKVRTFKPLNLLTFKLIRDLRCQLHISASGQTWETGWDT